MVSRAYLALCSLIIAILLGSGTWQMQGDRRAPGPAQVAHGRQRGYRHRAGRNGVLVGLYAALVLLATRLLSFQTPVAVAASTLVAAALFNPLRHRVQLRVDRRFNRTRYDADQMVAAFAARLKDTVELDSVRDDLAVAVHQALMPAHVSVWIKQDN